MGGKVLLDRGKEKGALRFTNTATGVIVEQRSYESLLFIPGEHVVQGYGDDEENFYFIPLEIEHKCRCHGIEE